MTRYDEATLHRLNERADSRAPHVDATRNAAAALHRLGVHGGPQVVVLGSAFAGTGVAHVRSERGFVPGDRLVRIGTVGHCAVYCDEEFVRMCPHAGLVLEVRDSANGRGTPLFLTRPESVAEYEQRSFNGQARQG